MMGGKPMGRPELGSVAVGHEVIVRQMLAPGRTTAEPATIVKIGRTWITLRAKGSGREWRKTIAGQTTKSGYGYESSFATPEQYAYDSQIQAARQFLHEQGISIRHDSPLYGDEATLTLAKLIREGLPVQS